MSDANSDYWKENCIRYYQEISDRAYEEIEKKSLSQYGVMGFICHLPIKGLSGGIYEEIYDITSECLSRLWDYSKEMGYIREDAGLSDFIKSGCDFRVFTGYRP